MSNSYQKNVPHYGMTRKQKKQPSFILQKAYKGLNEFQSNVKKGL